MAATRSRNIVIELTSDRELEVRLRNNLAEYASRYNFPYLAPEVNPQATYKYHLLKGLLSSHYLDVAEQEAAFARCSWHQPDAFREAVAIIIAYNAGGTAGIIGGTGLK